MQVWNLLHLQIETLKKKNLIVVKQLFIGKEREWGGTNFEANVTLVYFAMQLSLWNDVNVLHIYVKLN